MAIERKKNTTLTGNITHKKKRLKNAQIPAAFSGRLDPKSVYTSDEPTTRCVTTERKNKQNQLALKARRRSRVSKVNANKGTNIGVFYEPVLFFINIGKCKTRPFEKVV